MLFFYHKSVSENGKKRTGFISLNSNNLAAVAAVKNQIYKNMRKEKGIKALRKARILIASYIIMFATMKEEIG